MAYIFLVASHLQIGGFPQVFHGFVPAHFFQPLQVQVGHVLGQEVERVGWLGETEGAQGAVQGLEVPALQPQRCLARVRRWRGVKLIRPV